jgi:hypothetical protein
MAGHMNGPVSGERQGTTAQELLGATKAWGHPSGAPILKPCKFAIKAKRQALAELAKAVPSSGHSGQVTLQSIDVEVTAISHIRRERLAL